MYSLNVCPHFVQRINWVEASSPPRVCTCQTKTKLFSHFGHWILIVGMVWTFWSSSLMTVREGLPLRWTTRPVLNGLAFSDDDFLYPHFEHARTTTVLPPASDFVGARKQPHFGQNSMENSPCSPNWLGSLTKLKYDIRFSEKLTCYRLFWTEQSWSTVAFKTQNYTFTALTWVNIEWAKSLACIARKFSV